MLGLISSGLYFPVNSSCLSCDEFIQPEVGHSPMGFYSPTIQLTTEHFQNGAELFHFTTAHKAVQFLLLQSTFLQQPTVVVNLEYFRAIKMLKCFVLELCNIILMHRSNFLYFSSKVVLCMSDRKRHVLSVVT